jgi:hypothetical protein
MEVEVLKSLGLAELSVKERRAIIGSLAHRHPTRRLSDWLDLASSSRYYQCAGVDDAALLVRIEDVLADYPTYGCRRVTLELGWRGVMVNRKRVRRDRVGVMHSAERIAACRSAVGTDPALTGSPFSANPGLLEIPHNRCAKV